MARIPKIVKRISTATTKKGVIKGKNKKETKALIGGCVHHRLTKHGKLKSSIIIPDGEECHCTLCEGTFPARFYTNQEIREIVEAFIELNNQNKFTAVATNAGEEVVDYYVQAGMIASSYYKNSKKLRNVGEKQDNVKKKKNRHNDNSGSSAYGSWSQK